jgi:hypothetical protein
MSRGAPVPPPPEHSPAMAPPMEGGPSRLFSPGHARIAVVAGCAGALLAACRARADEDRAESRSPHAGEPGRGSLDDHAARPPSREAELTPDPAGLFAYARAHQDGDGNLEASVPPMCYTRTDGVSNPCWVCHTEGRGRTFLDDSDLQAAYDFSDFALTNRWTNFFAPPALAGSAAPSDSELLAYIRGDNYTPLRTALAALPDSYAGFRPDLELQPAAFDELGFARNGSGWRALRYVPLPGAFWPSNGAAGDVFVRLPDDFRRDAKGAPSLEIYRLNLSLVEAAMTLDGASSGGHASGQAVARPAARAADRAVEPVDERLLGPGMDADLDNDGALGITTRIRRLPAHYAGGAAAIPLVPFALPRGTELVHTLRYLDPDEPTFASRRLKELRYMRKVELPDQWGINQAYAAEADEKEEGLPPRYQGAPEVGLLGGFGWQLQAFIEDAGGALRLQSYEEHRTCMGCHGPIGITIDQTFSVTRKLPGLEGWRPQDLRGQLDRPQAGHRKGELHTYLERVRGGDETRSNDELLRRFFRGGRLITAELSRARPSTPAARRLDLAALLSPSRTRALALDRAYLALVRTQSFTAGRAPILAPVTSLHAAITSSAPTFGSTGLLEARRTYRDGRLLLDWSAP